MKLFGSLAALVPVAKARARSGVHRAGVDRPDAFYSEHCRHGLRLAETLQACVIFSRTAESDTEVYARYWHLSTSFYRWPDGWPLPNDKARSAEIMRAFFAADADLVWCGPPWSPEGRVVDAWHFWLFCDARWRPLRPRPAALEPDWRGVDQLYDA
jgi:hypothetical protein